MSHRLLDILKRRRALLGGYRPRQGQSSSSAAAAPPPPMTSPEIERNFDNALNQDQCFLFTFPPEIRHRIYEFILAPRESDNVVPETSSSYPNEFTERYSQDTYFYRLDHRTRWHCATELLRSCKQIYNEAWWMPFSLFSHTFWLAAWDRRPMGRGLPYYHDQKDFARALMIRQKRLYGVDDADSATHAAQSNQQHGRERRQQEGQQEQRHNIDHIQFLAQLWALEPGNLLSSFLDLPGFHPRSITITIRHTDWWYWEDDRPLFIRADWVRECAFPSSLQQIRLELETLERKREALDYVVDEVTANWYFRRKDGRFLTANPTKLSASSNSTAAVAHEFVGLNNAVSGDHEMNEHTQYLSSRRNSSGSSHSSDDGDDDRDDDDDDTNKSVTITRWQGSSTLNGERWLRDEIVPERLNYYMATISFTYDPDFKPPAPPPPRQSRSVLDELQNDNDDGTMNPSSSIPNIEAPQIPLPQWVPESVRLMPCVAEVSLRFAGIVRGMSALETVRRINEYRSRLDAGL